MLKGGCVYEGKGGIESVGDALRGRGGREGGRFYRQHRFRSEEVWEAREQGQRGGREREQRGSRQRGASTAERT
jgi:hypothetical protein